MYPAHALGCRGHTRRSRALSLNFATLQYALFLLLVVLLYWAVPRRAGRYLLIGASLLFYASWNVLYVPGFVVLILANWSLGMLAARPGRARLAIALAVILDLGLLAIVKYLDWVLGGTMGLLAWINGTSNGWQPLGIVLPLAISFVTFTQIAYVVDIARGRAPERHLGRYALFVSFFPHLIAGPIMRAHEFLPQVRHPRPFSVQFLRLALPLLIGGLLKKTIGDTLAPTADLAFQHPASASTLVVWIGVLAFAFQVFLDFSGYTDMALGSAWLMGFHLPPNFDWPYRSLSIADFWRRWHMTLSRWLRDYLYIPLGGNRKGRARTYLNLFLTMVLGGIWHGAGITFVIWGAWQGAGLVVNRWWTQNVRTRGVPGLPVALAWAATFLFALVGWVFFRATSLTDALTYLKHMVVPSHLTRLQGIPTVIPLLLVGLGGGQWTGWVPLVRRYLPDGSPQRYLAYGAGLAVAVMLVPAQTISFIYFQF